MPEAVIVAASRTPIGRAYKGSLIDERPDDLAALVIGDVLAKAPDIDPSMIEDVYLGCGSPAGEHGENIGRIAALLAGLVDVPGMTVNRYCSSSVLTTALAANAIRAGEGDAYIAGGVECISRYERGAADTGEHPNLRFASAMARTAQRVEHPGVRWSPGTDLPDPYLMMGLTASIVMTAPVRTRPSMVLPHCVRPFCPMAASPPATLAR
jgi:acetyl-CoA C-acetyltransferase